jgi:hypothetical protein
LQQVPLNTTDIGQALLNIEKKERSNPLAWNGQFSPQLIEVLLGTYARSSGTILDPFGGSGTLLYEAANRNLSGIATDINPSACYLAKIYTLANLNSRDRVHLVKRLDDALRENMVPELPLFGSKRKEELQERAAVGLVRLRKCMSDPNGRALLDALLILSDFFRNHCDSQFLFSTWKKLRSTVCDLSYCSQPLRVINCDARKLPLTADSVNLVITSPPYINVFNYHQNYRRSAEALGWNLLEVAKSEIGSNRKNRGNRFLTVIQYCLEISQVFVELARVSKKDARIIFVIGRESKVRGIPFFNGRLIGLLATQSAPFKLIMRQERVFKNRFGQSIFEDILHFVPDGREKMNCIEVAGEIACDALTQKLSESPKKAVADLEFAIRQAHRVSPSPIYTQSLAYSPLTRRNGAGT